MAMKGFGFAVNVGGGLNQDGFPQNPWGGCIGKEYRKKRFGATPSRCVPRYSGHRRAMGLFPPRSLADHSSWAATEPWAIIAAATRACCPELWIRKSAMEMLCPRDLVLLWKKCRRSDRVSVATTATLQRSYPRKSGKSPRLRVRSTSVSHLSSENEKRNPDDSGFLRNSRIVA